MAKTGFEDQFQKNGAGGSQADEKLLKAPSKASEALFRPVGQYVKDMSFECPVAPMFLSEDQREMDLKVAVTSAVLNAEQGLYETVLALRAQAVDGAGSVIFVAELAYSGVFEAQNLQEGQVRALLNVDGATLIFPFARQQFMAMLSASGFRPPLLEPINFAALYQNSKK